MYYQHFSFLSLSLLAINTLIKNKILLYYFINGNDIYYKQFSIVSYHNLNDDFIYILCHELLSGVLLHISVIIFI